MSTSSPLLTSATLKNQAASAAINGTHAKSVNANAPVTCSKNITILASAERVWNVLTNIEGWAQWQSDISKPNRAGPLASGTHFTWKTGGTSIRSTLHTVEPFTQFGWTGKTFGVFAIHNWTLSEGDGRTTVVVHESMEGLLATLFKGAFQRNLDRGMQTWLNLLKAECEK